MRFLYVLAGIISFLGALVFTLPADKALAWWGDDLGVQIQLYGPQGGIASGSASAVSIDGFQLDATRWRLHGLSLFKGRIGFVLNSEIDGQPIQALVESALGGRTLIHDLNANLPVASIMPLLGPAVLPVDGLLQITLPFVAIRDQRLYEAEGEIRLRSLAMSFMRPPLDLGSYNGLVTTLDEKISVELSEADGAPLNAKGGITLDADGRYKADVSLRARGNTEQRLRNQLKLLGSPDGQGWYRLKSQGQL